ncbi:hypothetical protein BD626DRAFT_481035 [Schizophyllum amplum]|uniref:pH-response transcription factor pacC/RIM101 n=1 Tax=Schizophyllum amplum TaxID=97359 RepID=A0A550CTT0_9AGAR|nr:hypothetical protein BD626DRAFT_481035 [Auriculariopsis ampla]
MAISSTSFPCPTCHKEFKRKGDLNRHKALHNGIRPHICFVCGKAFSQQSGLNTHKNTHTKEKPHHCGFCPRTFGDPSSCSRHRKETHFSRGGYVCPIKECNTSIKRRSAFVAHLRKHGENPDNYDIETMAPPPLDETEAMRMPELATSSQVVKEEAVDAEALGAAYEYGALYEAAYDPYAAYRMQYDAAYGYDYYNGGEAYLSAPPQAYGYETSPVDMWDGSTSSESSPSASSRENSSGPSYGPSSLGVSPAPFGPPKYLRESPDSQSAAAAPRNARSPYPNVTTIKREEAPVSLLGSDGFDEFDLNSPVPSWNALQLDLSA